MHQRLFLKQAFVTALALLFYQVCSNIPLSSILALLGGLDSNLGNERTGAGPLYSGNVLPITAVGLMSVLWGGMLREILRLSVIFCKRNYYSSKSSFWLLTTFIFVFAFALMDISRIIFSLHAAKFISSNIFSLLCIILLTGVAVTLCSIWLIDRFGLGYGIWMIFAFAGLPAVGRDVSLLFSMVSQGNSSVSLVMIHALIFVFFVVIVSILSAAKTGQLSALHGSFLPGALWPFLLAGTITDIVVFKIFRADPTVLTGFFSVLMSMILLPMVMLYRWVDLMERKIKWSMLEILVTSIPIVLIFSATHALLFYFILEKGFPTRLTAAQLLAIVFVALKILGWNELRVRAN